MTTNDKAEDLKVHAAVSDWAADEWKQRHDQLEATVATLTAEVARLKESRRGDHAIIDDFSVQIDILEAKNARYRALLGEFVVYDGILLQRVENFYGDPTHCSECSEENNQHRSDCLVTRARAALAPAATDFHAGIDELRALDPLPGVDVEAYMRDVRGDEDVSA